MRLPQQIWPCEHYAAIRWRCLVECKDPVLMRLRWRREIGLAVMFLGLVFVTGALHNMVGSLLAR